MKRTLFSITMLAMSFTGSAKAEDANVDPLEGFNRTVFTFNEGLNTVAIKPITTLYKFVTPDFLEKGISNFFSNLFYPKVIVNQLLQGKPMLALQDTTRFVVNSTIGIGGLLDVASDGGLEAHSEDFGQTLAVWGFEESPYLVLPIFGPSTVRDGIGKLPDMYMNPMFHVEDKGTRRALLAGSIVDARSNFMKAEELITGDKYLFLRDAYLQRRQFLINDKKAAETDPFVDNE